MFYLPPSNYWLQLCQGHFPVRIFTKHLNSKSPLINMATAEKDTSGARTDHGVLHRDIHHFKAFVVIACQPSIRVGVGGGGEHKVDVGASACFHILNSNRICCSSIRILDKQAVNVVLVVFTQFRDCQNGDIGVPWIRQRLDAGTSRVVAEAVNLAIMML